MNGSAPDPVDDDLTPDVRAALRQRLQAERDAGLHRTGQASALRSADRVDRLDPLAQNVLDLERDVEGILDDARTRDALEPIEEALERLDDGTYGHCTDCGSAIGSARLLALPYARRCLSCQEAIGRPRR